MTLESGNFQNSLNDLFALLNKWFKVHNLTLSFDKTSGMIPATNNKAVLVYRWVVIRKQSKNYLKLNSLA